ncbi:hypothetical protein R1flu_001019 [Riccia fluitans]|uniref:Uncharacterized protein n=1 Tax=Riccia fluitans TaxID=41844 RepID=A0ABD1Y330_9MARC
MRGTVSTVLMMYTLLLLIGVAIFLLMRIIRTSSLILFAGLRTATSRWEEKPNGEAFASEQACTADHITDLRHLHKGAWTVITSSPRIDLVHDQGSTAAINTTAMADGKLTMHIGTAMMASLHAEEKAERRVAVVQFHRSTFNEVNSSYNPLFEEY